MADRSKTDMGGYQPWQAGTTGLLTAYEPTWKDRIARALMADSKPSPERARLVEGLAGSRGMGTTGMGLLDFIPVAGQVLQTQEALRFGDTDALAMALIPGSKPRIPLNKSSRSPSIYDPPQIAQRPFDADYGPANPARADASGRLTHTINGDPITAPYVAGRRMVGGGDEAITPAQYDAIATAATGRGPTMESPREMGSDLGRTIVDRLTGRTKDLQLRNNLTEAQRPRVYAHELGHVVNDWATQAQGIPTSGLLKSDLKPLYNNLNNPTRARVGTPEDGLAAGWAKPVNPTNFKYKEEEAPHEYMAEAIRAYMANPGYMKEKHPEVAKRIREYVNTHPQLSKIIQFNSVPIAGYGLGNILEEDRTKAGLLP